MHPLPATARTDNLELRQSALLTERNPPKIDTVESTCLTKEYIFKIADYGHTSIAINAPKICFYLYLLYDVHIEVVVSQITFNYTPGHFILSF